MRRRLSSIALLGLWMLAAIPWPSHATEVVLQYFGTSWLEIARRMPELAEAGYTSLWLPPPQKASGGLSVGFDTCDRFDLGHKSRNGLATKYGTLTDLVYMMEVAHRFGIRVYFDNIMAHTGGFMPQGEPYQLNDLGFVPADFHLVRRSDGTYYKMDWPDWNDEWQVLHRNPFAWDIANTPGLINYSFGSHEGAQTQKWVGVRHPNNPEYYDWDTNGNPAPFGSVTQEMLNNNSNVYMECVNMFLDRSIRWLIGVTKCDGFRLDAVKHVPNTFFGADGEGKDESDYGYTGQIQRQFNRTHSFADSNHRDTLFNPDIARNDAMLFGEHLSAPPAEGPYLERGMRIANDGFLNAVKESVGNGLNGMDQRGYGIWGGDPHQVAIYVMSHDNNWLWGGDSSYPWGDRPQAHAIMLGREGLPIVYTDGYNQAGEPDWFPKPAHVPFLGQFTGAWRGAWLPNLLHIRRHFGWGGHWPKWGDQDHVVWVRGSGDDHNGASMMFAMVRRYAGGDRQPFELVNSVFNEGDILYKYGTWGAFPVKVQGGKVRELDGGAISVGPGDWWAISWRIPEMPPAWTLEDGWWKEDVHAIMIHQNGQPAEIIWVPRKDGRDGDPAFNPYGLPNANTTNYTYYMPIPRVTSSSNLSFIARADGTTENVLMKLDGGVDLNAQMWTNNNHQVGARDNAPGASTDMFLGFEQMRFVQRIAEKFASDFTEHNLWGSPGATSYECTIGQAGITANNPAETPNDWQSTYGPAWLYHDPNAGTQFSPAPQSAAGQPIQIELEIGYHPNNSTNKTYLYYTTDGASWPEGSGGVGKGNTKVIEMTWNRMPEADKHWWRGTIPAQTNGTKLRYKIGAYRRNIGARFPWSLGEIYLGSRMETLFEVTNFNAGTIEYFPHNNWNTSQMKAGLHEGFHVLRTKSFLGREFGHAPIYRERVQTFYYDAARPTGYIVWPQNDDEWVSGSYGFVLRSDMTVSEVWYQIYETPDGFSGTTRPWAKAYRALVPTPLEDGTLEQEWRFEYDNIATSGWATVSVVLREASSSSNLALNDEAGHFTTLTRELITGGGYRIYAVDPPSGSIVGHGSNLVVWLSRELWDGIGQPQQLACFSLAVNGVTLSNVQKTLRYDASGEWGDHEIKFTLPSFYNGDPDFPHTLEVTYQRAGFDTRKTSRLVYARPEGGLIPPGWEMQWGLQPGTLDPSGMGDYDGDGVTDYEEYTANTNPNDRNDFLRVETAAVQGLNLFDMEFLARENRHYYVWETETLTPPDWSRVNDSPISGEGVFTNFPVDIEGILQQYYRLQVTLP